MKHLHSRLCFFLTCWLLSVSTLVTYAQEYQFTVDAPGFAGSELYIAGYRNGKALVRDTLQLDDKGWGVFSGEKPLRQGMYLLWFSKQQFIDFLVEEDQKLHFQVDTLMHLKLEGAEQSVAFNSYIQFLAEKKQLRTQLLAETKNGPSEQTSQLALIDKQVSDYQQELIKRFNNKLLALFIRGSLPVQVPDSIKNKADSEAVRRYIQHHYWDMLTLSDERIHTFNYFPDKMKEFLNVVVYQHYDSITQAAIRLVEQSRGGDEAAFRQVLSACLNFAAAHKMMGVENLYIQLAQRYYLSGLVPQADHQLLQDMQFEVSKNQHCLMGMKAYNLRYSNEAAERVQLYDGNADYTLLYFYDPGCGHCQSFTQSLSAVVEKYTTKGLQLIAFNTRVDAAQWQQFRTKHPLPKALHGWDPDRKSEFWSYFDTSVTPVIYLLDKHKTIIARKLDATSLDKLLARLIH